jgi:hypothetical protein
MRSLFLVAVGLVVFAGCGKSEPSNRRDADITPSGRGNNPALKVSTQASAPEEDPMGVDVWTAFKNNAKLAEEKYLYKRAQLTGIIVEVNKGQEFPPSWGIFLKRSGEEGRDHYLVTVSGDIGQGIVKHAITGHEMTIQGSITAWNGPNGPLFMSGDKLIQVK